MIQMHEFIIFKVEGGVLKSHECDPFAFPFFDGFLYIPHYYYKTSQLKYWFSRGEWELPFPASVCLNFGPKSRAAGPWTLIQC